MLFQVMVMLVKHLVDTMMLMQFHLQAQQKLVAIFMKYSGESNLKPIASRDGWKKSIYSFRGC